MLRARAKRLEAERESRRGSETTVGWVAEREEKWRDEMQGRARLETSNAKGAQDRLRMARASDRAGWERELGERTEVSELQEAEAEGR